MEARDEPCGDRHRRRCATLIAEVVDMHAARRLIVPKRNKARATNAGLVINSKHRN
jgi:hypothetical protein